MITNETLLRALRNQAWSRAKGELQAMLDTFVTGQGGSRHDQYDEASKAVTEFINAIEEDGLHE